MSLQRYFIYFQRHREKQQISNAIISQNSFVSFLSGPQLQQKVSLLCSHNILILKNVMLNTTLWTLAIQPLKSYCLKLYCYIIFTINCGLIFFLLALMELYKPQSNYTYIGMVPFSHHGIYILKFFQCIFRSSIKCYCL